MCKLKQEVYDANILQKARNASINKLIDYLTRELIYESGKPRSEDMIMDEAVHIKTNGLFAAFTFEEVMGLGYDIWSDAAREWYKLGGNVK